MPRKLPLRDPSAAYQRVVTAARRVGAGSQCACGENRPEALIAGSKPIMCAACSRKKQGRRTSDDHHVAGRANSPITVSVPVNDHRAVLSVAQKDWPKETLENSDGSPLLAGAARIRGFVDTVRYLLEELCRIAVMIEELHEYLVKHLGSRWWVRSWPFGSKR